MKVRRTKPYVCVDVDFADHFRFQATVDLDAAAGVWLQCLAHSRGQEQDGVVTAAWLRRTFAINYGRVEELVKVGLLCARPDGDFEIHAYAPRNQTRDMLSEGRASTRERVREWRSSKRAEETVGDDVTRYTSVTAEPVTEYETGCNALVPTSTSLFSSVSSDLSLGSISGGHVEAITRAHSREREERSPLPPSERGLSGPYWLSAFSEGITDATGRPCTVGRMYLTTLERIVTHHAPERDAPRASAWLKAEAKTFAAQWDGKHPGKGLTPDGLERWLNEGRQGPPVFGCPRIVQPPAEDWHEDDWTDLAAKVGE